LVKVRLKWLGLLLCILFLVSPALTSLAEQAKRVEVSVDKLNVRSGPGLGHKVIGSVSAGVKLPVKAEKDGWYQVTLPDGRIGWIAGWLVKPVDSGTQVYVWSNEEINIRSGPGTSFAVIGSMEPKKKYPLLKESGQWANIQVTEGQTGWVAAWLVYKETLPKGEGLGQSTQPEDSGQTAAAGNDAQVSKMTVTVNVPTVNVRSGPSTQDKLLMTLNKDTVLPVLEQKGDWYRVSLPAGGTGWVAGWLVKPTSPQTGKEKEAGQATATILHPDTNVRSGPGTQYTIVTRVQKGEQFPILRQDGDWFQIRLANGKTGYIAGWLVTAEGMPNVDKSDKLKDMVIVVDAGHGGKDTGAIGTSFSTLEKTVNLEVAKLLKDKLEAAGATVIMTRTDDRKLTLQERVDAAVDNNADLFVSVHHNTHPNSFVNGTIVFYYEQGESSKLAMLVQREIVKTAGYKDLSARFGNYFVLRENPVTSILVEVGFLTNYQDEAKARSSKQQDLTAEGIFKGILAYVQEE
jgi:N-acetylmuramoyl-L-alanine amidase